MHLLPPMALLELGSKTPFYFSTQPVKDCQVLQITCSFTISVRLSGVQFGLQSILVQVSNKIRQLCTGSPICLITSMITD